MFRPFEAFIGLRYTRAKRRNHFISFISFISIIGIALGVTALVTVLSVVLLGRRTLLAVGAVCAALMVGIAWKSAVPRPGEGMVEARLEAIAQFLPTYVVVVGVLWLREHFAERGARP